jgi:hypothetical protein
MNSTQVNAQPPMNAADFYGLRAKMLLGVRQTPTASQVSGGLGKNSGKELHPAFSWVSLVALLVLVRIFQGMIPSG